MRLIDVSIAGFRRFAKTKVNLDGGTIAIVGPNEAGKSSLLEAVYRSENNDPIPISVLTRGQSIPASRVVVKARYLLDSGDRAIVEETGGMGQPRWYVIEKLASGAVRESVDPPLRRNRSSRDRSIVRLEKALANDRLRRLLSKSYPAASPDANEVEPESPSLGTRLAALRGPLSADVEDLDSELLEEVSQALSVLERCLDKAPASNKRAIGLIETELTGLFEAERQEHPNSQVVNKLSSRRPRFLLFGEDARQLASEYNVDVLTNPPAALRNLLEAAKLPIADLQQALSRDDHGKRAYLEENANRTLKEEFQSAWGQSDVFVHLALEPSTIRILVNARDTYAPIAERSDGLRAFVALWAVTSLRGRSDKPILLVDEAETHLHYDAQADLIRVFGTQTVASQVIYTTHSAGCLPNDLGIGIRVVRPIFAADRSDTGNSVVDNAFWTAGPGFSALLMGMGASVMAMVPTRRAVISEGPSDAIMLPSLIREVVGLEELGFQVVPGLATVSEEEAGELDLEAPRVAYLVDGDSGGTEHRKKLLAAGIAADDLIQLSRGLVAEDLVRIDVYVAAVNEELRRSHGHVHQLRESDIPSTQRPTAVAKWCRANGIDPPHKTKVAQHVVDQRTNHRTRGDLVATDQQTEVRRIHTEIARVLGIQPRP